MPRLSAVEAINPAIELTRAMLGRPFRFKTWLKIGFIGAMAGAGSFSGFSYRNSGTGSRQGGPAPGDLIESIANFFRDHLILILTIVALGFIIWIVFLYLSCRFRFVLFDTVLSRDAQIGRGWRGFRRQSNRYFGFMICFVFVTGLALALVVGVPIWQAWKSGAWLNDDPMALILRYVLPIALGVVFVVMGVLGVSMLANDFLVPLMAIEDMTIGSGWKRLKNLAWSEPWPFAAYLGLKPVLSLAAGIAVGLIMLLALLVLLIPAALLVVPIVFLFKAGPLGMGLGFLLACLGIVVAIICGVVLSLMTTAPLAVFMTAYSLYFFGGRYPRLGEMLWPQPPLPITPPTTPPPPLPGAAPAS